MASAVLVDCGRNWVHSGGSLLRSEAESFLGALALAAFLTAGAFHIQARAGLSRIDSSILPFADREELQVTAHVVRDGRLQEREGGELRQAVDVEAEEIRTEAGTVLPVHSGIRLGIYSQATSDAPESPAANSASAMRLLLVGERISFAGKLRRPRNFPQSRGLRL